MAQAEVAEHGSTVGLEEDVSRRDVPVHDAEVMQPPDRGGDRCKHGDDLACREMAPSPHQPVERSPAQVRHRERDPTVGQRDTRLDPDDVGGCRTGRHRGLACGGIHGVHCGVDQLEDDAATPFDLRTCPHLTRGATPQYVSQLETGHDGHLRHLRPWNVPELRPPLHEVTLPS